MKNKISNRCEKEKDIEQFIVYYKNIYGYKERLNYYEECEPKKICVKCKLEKSIYEFYYTKKYADKRSKWCKDCIDKYYEKNPDEKYQWIEEYHKYYYKKNREKILKNRKEKRIIKKKEIKRKLNSAISSAISQSLKGNKKGRHWEDIVGWTLEKLMPHFKKQFKPDKKGKNMTWENYGRGGWEIEHIRPIDSFNFTSYKSKEFKQCWALDNLQPLWWYENRSKSKKYPNKYTKERDKIEYEEIKEKGGN